jgi:hypothetical protein
MSTATLAELVTELVAKAPVQTEIRKIPSIKIGQSVRQGDIYITRFDPAQKTINLKNRITLEVSQYCVKGLDQLVPGTTTGSRHCVTQTPEVRVKINPQNTQSLLGPIIEADTTFTVTHPKHAHMELPAGHYFVTYQLNAVTRQRVKD